MTYYRHIDGLFSTLNTHLTCTHVAEMIATNGHVKDKPNGIARKIQCENFFQALIFTSNRRRTSSYYKISIKDFFPRIPKLPSDLKLVHWGPSYEFFKHHFFQALIFTSNRRRTSSYYKISIKDFFPRIPKLPSDLKLVHWGPLKSTKPAITTSNHK